MTRDASIADFGSFPVNLRHLRVFHAVAAAGGVRRSSDTLWRAPSAVTRSVAALEAVLGTALFERKGRGMLLTAAGRDVLEGSVRIATWLAEVHCIAAGDAAPARAVPEALFNTGRLIAATALHDLHRMPAVARLTQVTQPAVSAAIKGLEDALGQRLFERHAKGTRPTELGVQAVARFRQVLKELHHIEVGVAARSGVLQGVVRVGTLPPARTSLLPAALAALAERWPRLRMRTVESPYEELIAGLLAGDIDFIVGGLRPTQDPDLLLETLGHESPAVYARQGHPLARRRGLRCDQLSGCRWVLPSPGTPLRASLRQAFEAAGCEAPLPSVETDDLAVLLGLLLHSDMVTAQLPSQWRHELSSGQIVRLPVPLQRSGAPHPFGLMMRRGARLTPGAQVLMAEIRVRATP